MKPDPAEELKRIKREFIAAEKNHEREKEGLINALNVFATAASMTSEFAAESRAIKEMLAAERRVAIDSLDEAVSVLKQKIFSKETGAASSGEDSGPPARADERLLKACLLLRSAMAAILDDFYPVTERMQKKAAAIRIRCHSEMSAAAIEAPAQAFLEYVKILKRHILDDFRISNRSFFKLFEELKDLEKMLTGEFDQQAQIREIEHFENKVNEEVVSIVDSFNMNATIQEIKNAVARKLKNIKRLVARKKEAELHRTRKARQKIGELRKRIDHAEKDIREISQKASQFKKSAARDGLTRLYNRQAFDMRLKQALESFNAGGESFLLILFDVNRLKWINDVHGHISGDRVLKVVARCLQDTFREDDFIARYGGDEFVVVAGGLSEKTARERVLAFSQKLKRMRFVTRTTQERVEISASAGISAPLAGQSAEELIHRADTAMYAVKRKDASS